MQSLIVANLSFTAAMFGVIWVIQLVHYPMLAGLEPQSFAQWHAFHSRRITWIVLPLMVSELVLSFWLVGLRRDLSSSTALAFTIGIWLSTFFLSVPLHDRLGRAPASEVAETQDLVRRLVATNWIRTIGYSLKLLVLIQIVSSVYEL